MVFRPPLLIVARVDIASGAPHTFPGPCRSGRDQLQHRTKNCSCTLLSVAVRFRILDLAWFPSVLRPGVGWLRPRVRDRCSGSRATPHPGMEPGPCRGTELRPVFRLTLAVYPNPNLNPKSSRVTSCPGPSSAPRGRTETSRVPWRSSGRGASRGRSRGSGVGPPHGELPPSFSDPSHFSTIGWSQTCGIDSGPTMECWDVVRCVMGR